MGAPVHSEIIIMKAFIFATVLAVAEAGEHAALAPAAVATVYLADLPEVAEAKDAFRVVFDKYANGEVALPVAPVHEVAPVAAAPVAVAAPVVAPYLHAAYPYAHAYAGYPYAHAAYPYAHAAYPFAHAGFYGAYPYALPTVAVAPAKAE